MTADKVVHLLICLIVNFCEIDLRLKAIIDTMNMIYPYYLHKEQPC